jgi:L-aspartate oxidase
MAELDLLVVGSGIAGLSAAVRAARLGMEVGVITKASIAETATGWAQGGVAAVLSRELGDSIESHLHDTLAAGAGLCDEDAVRVLVEEGPVRVRELIRLGARFDREADGELQLAREGGHSYARVVHAGGAATGAEIERALVAATAQTAAVVHEHTLAVDLIVVGGRCRGVRVRRPDGATADVEAREVLVATGGAGQLFAVTTNPHEATGDGIAMALRAGVAVADVEFVQFHPTALVVDRSPRPLLSEALRGHGALLLDQHHRRFVDELLPRDIVARAILAQAQADGRDYVWLDARPIEGFAERYPTLFAVLRESGLDPANDLLPVAPAAHYLCGGILTDLDGATSLTGLWAAGEAACSGIHGANRLASNSLLEGLVFGSRVVERLVRGGASARPTGALRALHPGSGGFPGSRIALPPGAEGHRVVDRRRLQEAMTSDSGVLRDSESLARAAKVAARPTPSRDLELANLALLARAVIAAAEARTESRGAHARTDFPQSDPDLARRFVL